MMEMELSMPLEQENTPTMHVSIPNDSEKQKPNPVSLDSTSVPAKFNLVEPNHCTHMVKSLSMAGLRKGFKADVKPYCHPCTFKSKSSDLKLDLSWVCLQCGSIDCGDINAQNGDAMKHFKTPRSDLHSIVVQLGEDYRSWCFTCQSELNSHNAHLKDGVVFIKKMVKGKLAFELGARKKQIEKDGESSSIPLLSLPAPPPIPPAPKAYNHKQNNYGKNNTVGAGGKFSKPYQNGGDIGDPMAKPLGLENLGNTCFMNAALQCLSRTKLLIPKLDLFGSGENVPVLVTPTEDGQAKIIVQNGSEIQEDIPATLPLPEESSQWEKPFIVDLEISPESMTARLKHTLKAITRQGEVRNGNKHGGFYCGVRPYDVHNMVSKSFKPGGQHDSHELLRSIVDMLKKDQTKAFRAGIMKKFGVAKGGEGSDPKVVAFVKSLDQRVKHQTFVDEIFGGELMTTQTCLTCNSIKRSHEEFLDLSLPLRVSKGNQSNPKSNNNSTYISSSSFLDYSENENIVINRTVEECLNSLTEPELLTGSNVVECENCHKANLEKVQNGAAFEDVFPNIGKPSKPVLKSVETSPQKSGKSKGQDDRKKRRPSRQSRIKNQISRNAQDSKQATSFQEIKNSQPSGPSPSVSLLENYLTTVDVGWTENTKSNLDDYVVVSQADVDVLSGTNCSKRKFTDVDDMDVDDCDVPVLDSQTDFALSGPSQTQDSNAKSDEECDGDADSDLPSAADGVGGSTSDVEDNDVPPIDLDLPDYDKFDHFQVPQLSAAETTDLDMEKGTADEGYSEGSGGTESALVAGGLTTKETPMTQSLSQESSCQNSISDPEENSKDGSEGAIGETPAKEPPITKCPCSRQQSISRPPKFLTIHLKRFQISPRGYTSKLSDHVDFPIMLDLTRYCAVSSDEAKDQVFDEDGQVMYSLYGIVEHSGSLHWGHYVAYIRVPAAEQPNGEIQKDTWYYISDSQVSFYSENSITHRDPYILFYERVRGETKRAREKLAMGTNQHLQLQNGGGYFGNTNGWASSSSTTTKADTAAAWDENWDEEPAAQVYGPLPAPEIPDREIITDVGRPMSPPEKMDDADDEDDFYIPPLPGFEENCDDDPTFPRNCVWSTESGINDLTNNLNLNLNDVTEMADSIVAEAAPTDKDLLWQTYRFFNSEEKVESETGLPWDQQKESTILACEGDARLQPQCSEEVMEVETQSQPLEIPILSAMNFIDDSSEEIH